MSELDKIKPVFAAPKDEGRKEAAAPERAQRVKNPEELAADVLAYLAERLGTQESYGSKISQQQITGELYDRFGEYDPDVVNDRWKAVRNTPASITNPTLKSIASDDHDHSYLSEVVAFTDPILVPIRRKLEQLQAVTDLPEKKNLLAGIRGQISRAIERRKYTIFESGTGDRPMELWDLEHGTPFGASFKRGRSVRIDDIAEALQKTIFDIKFEDTLGSLDRSKLESATLVYGAKGANMEELARIRTAVNSFGHFDFKIPEYRLVSTSLYEKWKAGSDIRQDAEELYRWVDKRKVILRSSAVYSEDAESATGAGIYESTVLHAEGTFEEFLEHLISVYASTDSAEAVTYREAHNIAQEKMGVVVQEFIDAKDAQIGYVNSIVKNVPALMEIAYKNGLRPIVVKSKAHEAIISGDDDPDILHYEFDRKRKSIRDINEIAFVATLLEKYYGQAIQIEFLQPEEDEVRQTYLVQVRFLPKSFSEARRIEFPDAQPLFEGRALGVFDATLPVLPNYRDNTEKDGVVIFDSSRFFSRTREGERYQPQDAFPKSGAIIVFGPPEQEAGHIETLCAEKGLALIFSDQFPERTSISRSTYAIFRREEMGAEVRRDNFKGYKELRLVSDGLQGKVYGVGEKSSE